MAFFSGYNEGSLRIIILKVNETYAFAKEGGKKVGREDWFPKIFKMDMREKREKGLKFYAGRLFSIRGT